MGVSLSVKGPVSWTLHANRAEEAVVNLAAAAHTGASHSRLCLSPFLQAKFLKNVISSIAIFSILLGRVETPSQGSSCVYCQSSAVLVHGVRLQREVRVLSH